jgi:branched-chain amino acid transport system ATP-binding protein
MLRLSQLSAGYGAAPVLQAVSLWVDDGETVALLGPNGAGKSTLLGALTGTIRHRTGVATFDGSDLINEASHAIVARGVALVPEGRLVFAPFSVQDNLRLGAIRLSGGRAALAERFEYVYKLFPRLAERRLQAAGTLSGGEQQMLAIARALMSRPRLLLLDEPSLGLAPLVVKQIFEVIRELNERDGMTVFLVEQNAYHALKLAHRGYVMVTGTITMSGTGQELLADPQVQAAYLEGGRR